MKLLQFIKPLLLTVLIAVSGSLHAQYTGGNASGSVVAISLQSICSPTVYLDIYKGGNDDGFEAVAFIQVNCSPTALPNIYAGGIDDGYSSSGLTQANCSPIVLPNIYAGGIDDGYSSLGVTQANCSPIVYPDIYAGGIDDGYSSFGVTQSSCSPHVYPDIYAGGIEDGYASFGLTQANCDPHVYPNIYAGGIDDGHAMVAMLTACAPFANFVGDKLEICEGDTVNFTDLSLGTPTSWSWTFNGGNPATSTEQNPSVVYNTAGTYSVSLLITSATGNSAMAKTDYILVKPAPVPVIAASGSTTFCDGDSVLITCNPAYDSYLWSNGNTTQNTYVHTSGSHKVIATSNNGCSGESNTIVVDVLTNPKPTVYVNGPVPSCIGDTIVLTSSLANSYDWTPSGKTTQSITVINSGTHWVSATYANGCSRLSDPVAVNFGTTPAKPIINALGPLTFCEGGSVTLQSSPAPGYLWHPDSQTTQSVVISASGVYYVEAVGASGCTNVSDPITVTVNPKAPVPTISASGPLTFCDGDSVVLTSSVASSYLWAPGGETTRSITVKTSGTYSVQADNGTGCTSTSSSVVVTVNAQTPVPTISASGPLTFCDGDSVVLTSSVASSYLWSPGGETTRSITVKTSGTYSVQADNGTGCTSTSSSVVVTVNAQTPVPTITASGPLTFCDGDSVVLTSSVASSYLWSPGGETTRSITVKTSGTYSVQADNGTGCTSTSSSVVVTVNAQTPVPTISASGPLTFCDGDSVVLTSSVANSYLWSPGGETTRSITVKTSGTYSVQADNGTGCTSESSAVVVTVNAQTPVPTISASGPLTFCDGDSVVLTSSVANSYLWSPGGEITRSITVKASGTYTVQADNGTGCSAVSSSVVVTVNPTPSVPTISLSGPTSFCNGDSVVLTASPASSYLWYPGGETTQSITVTTEGTYYVEVSNGSCKAMSLPVNIDVLSVPSVPTITLSGSNNICEGDSVLLTSSPASSYLWYPGGETTQSIWVSTSGTYWVEVFNSLNCSSVSSAQSISVHSNPSVSISGDILACQGTSQFYTITNLPSTDYFWTVSGATIVGGVGTNSIEVLFNNEGNATIEVTVVNQVSGCSSSDVLTVNTLLAPIASAGPDLSICYGDTAQLQASGGTVYNWTPNIGLSASNVSNPYAFPLTTTQYIVEVANGTCIDRDTMLLTVYPLPVVDAGSDIYIIMSGECATLNGSGGVSYYWQPATGLNNQTINSPEACPTETTVYTLLVTDANGCSAKDSVIVIVFGYSGDVVLPNTFTPNDDGINDTWVIDGLGAYPENKLVVFNRWGNKVYDAKPYLNDWDGRSIGKPLPDGTYYFVLDLGDGSEIIRSFVTIVR